MSRKGVKRAALHAALAVSLGAVGGCGIALMPDSASVALADAGALPTVDAGASLRDAGKTTVVMSVFDSGTGADILATPMVSPLCGGGAVDGGVACQPGQSICTPPPEAVDAAPAYPGVDAGVGAVPSFSCHVTAALAEAGAAVAVAVCSSSGAGKNDATCASSSDCAPGFECVVDATVTDTSIDGATAAAVGVCRRYCCDDVCTPAGSFCDIETTVSGAVAVPVCVERANAAATADAGPACELLDDSTCGPGLTCQVVNKNTGQVACVTPGTASAGQSCETNKCAKGLSCIAGEFPDRTCAELCDQQSDDCPAGQMCMPSAVLSSVNAQIGVCSQDS